MRVIAGKYKSRILKAPKLDEVRPTQDRIKESMFEILKPYLPGADVLELFAGSGSLGIEALSRGAKSVTFVEQQPLCLKTIQQNLDSLGIKVPTASIVGLDVFKAIKRFAQRGEKFSLVIADPPYGWGYGYVRKLLIKFNIYDILRTPFIILIEHSLKEYIPQKEDNIILLKQYNYMDTLLSIYRKEI